jgi:hypothetical protein
MYANVELTRSAAGSGEPRVAAAKLHVLRLGPIKAKMGDRWERLSDLVHKLFERSLQHVQGPHDHFLRLDEMSYVVSFHRLSVEEASLACAAIAKETCELLFGADVEDISVRSMISDVPLELFKTGPAAGLKISQLLEEKGGETIVSLPSVGIPSALPSTGTAWTEGEGIAKAHYMAGQEGWSMGFFPVWDLQKRQSFSLYASLYSGAAPRHPVGVRRALNALSDDRIVEMEVAMLYAAAEYAGRVHAAQKICVLGVGASYETLSGLHSRIRYTSALKAIRAFSDCPVLVRLGPIPVGTPLGRIAEIVAMMNVPNVRVVLEFQTPRSLPEMDIRLGVAGIGAALPVDCDTATAGNIAQQLVRQAAGQKAFTFLNGLSNPALVRSARSIGIRAGSGIALGGANHFYTEKQPVPQFPLLAEAEKWLV